MVISPSSNDGPILEDLIACTDHINGLLEYHYVNFSVITRVRF